MSRSVIREGSSGYGDHRRPWRNGWRQLSEYDGRHLGDWSVCLKGTELAASQGGRWCREKLGLNTLNVTRCKPKLGEGVSSLTGQSIRSNKRLYCHYAVRPQLNVGETILLKAGHKT